MENVLLGGKTYFFHHAYRTEDAPCAAMSALSQKVFDLDFMGWRNAGYWSDLYRPYTLFDGDRAVSNVSINILRFDLDNKERNYIQFGTVMTDPEYRMRGLCAYLMRRALDDWADGADMTYLYASDQAKDFYPHFGFRAVREAEYLRVPQPAGQNLALRKLDLKAPGDYALVMRLISSLARHEVLPMRGNPGLTMFYLAGGYSDNLYYSQALDALLVIEREDGETKLHEVFSPNAMDILSLTNAVAREGDSRVVLGFAPKDARGFETQALQEDGAFYAMGKDAHLFTGARLRFPVLSRT